MLRHLFVVTALLASSVAEAHQGLPAEIADITGQLRERPGDVDLLLRRADAYRREGKLDLSLADLRQAAARAPLRRDIALERGLVLIAEGKPSAAEAELSRYLDAGPPTAQALRARGEIREAIGRWAGARADYNAALKLTQDADLYLARGRADEALGDLDRAAAGYEEGLLALHGAVVLRVALVRVEAARGRYDRAVALIDEVLPAAPRKAEWLLRRADVHAAAGRPGPAERDRQSALSECDAAIGRRPNDLTRLTRAKALIALGRDADALPELERVARSSPELPEVATLLQQTRSRAFTRRDKP